MQEPFLVDVQFDEDGFTLYFRRDSHEREPQSETPVSDSEPPAV